LFRSNKTRQKRKKTGREEDEEKTEPELKKGIRNEIEP